MLQMAIANFIPGKFTSCERGNIFHPSAKLAIPSAPARYCDVEKRF